MRDKASVIKYENGVVSVIPLLSDTCINCNSPTCAKRGRPFQASNPHQFELRPGDIVKIEAPAAVQLTQGFFSLLLPVLAAVAGFFLAEPIAAALGHQVTEGMRAGGVLVMLAVTTLGIFVLSRSRLKLSKPQVTAVIHNGWTEQAGECLL